MKQICVSQLSMTLPPPLPKNTQIIPSVGTPRSLLYSVTTLFLISFVISLWKTKRKSYLYNKSWELADWLNIDRNLRGVSTLFVNDRKNSRKKKRHYDPSKFNKGFDYFEILKRVRERVCIYVCVSNKRCMMECL